MRRGRFCGPGPPCQAPPARMPRPGARRNPCVHTRSRLTSVGVSGQLGSRAGGRSTAHDYRQAPTTTSRAPLPGRRSDAPAFMGLHRPTSRHPDLWAHRCRSMHLCVERVALTGRPPGRRSFGRRWSGAAILSRGRCGPRPPRSWIPCSVPRRCRANLREARAVWEALGRLPDPTSLDCVGAEVREIPRSAVRVAIDALEDAGLVERVIRGEEERKRGAVPILVRRARHMT